MGKARSSRTARGPTPHVKPCVGPVVLVFVVLVAAVAACASDRGPTPLHGGAGADVLEGSRRADSMFGGGGGDRLRGLAGNDVLRGEAGDDVLFGGAGDDALAGGPGDDRLFGGPGEDEISGGKGDDTIDSGAGRDTLTGGPGADLFIMDLRWLEQGPDRITDFRPEEGDRIVITGFNLADLEKLKAALGLEGGLLTIRPKVRERVVIVEIRTEHPLRFLLGANSISFSRDF